MGTISVEADLYITMSAERGNDPFRHVALFKDAQRPGAIDMNPFDNLSIQRNAP